MLRATKALKRRRIVVTRPRAQARGLGESLRKAGARVLFAPLIKILPPRSYAGLDAALRRWPDFDCAVFSSRNAVDSFFSRVRRLRLRPQAPRRVFAVGPATAASLRERGWKPQGLPQRYDAAALGRAMGEVRGWRILIPRSELARDELPRLLRRRGARVVCADAYRPAADPAGARRLRAAAKTGLHAVTFTSPSTVDGFVGALGLRAARRLARRAVPVSIGPVTSAALRRHGIRPLQASEATAEGLVAGLAAHFSARR